MSLKLTMYDYSGWFNYHPQMKPQLPWSADVNKWSVFNSEH